MLTINYFQNFKAYLKKKKKMWEIGYNMNSHTCTHQKEKEREWDKQLVIETEMEVVRKYWKSRFCSRKWCGRLLKASLIQELNSF